MLALKAVLLCETVRPEIDGTLTLIGVHGETFFAPPGTGPITESFSVLVVVRGLRGVRRVGIRHAIRPALEVAPTLAPDEHVHDPANDEHNFIFERTTLSFAESGRFALDIAVAADGETLRATHTFRVERRR